MNRKIGEGAEVGFHSALKPHHGLAKEAMRKVRLGMESSGKNPGRNGIKRHYPRFCAIAHKQTFGRIVSLKLVEVGSHPDVKKQ